MNRRHQLSFLGLLLVGLISVISVSLVSCQPSQVASPKPILVAAGASLTDALQEVELAYRKSSNSAPIRHNFASSGALQQQIEQGAPIDVFISAAAKPMNQLEKAGLIVAGTRRDLLQNQLVLVVSASTTGITRLEDLQQASVRRIAIGESRSVPAGQYAQQALMKTGLWEKLQSKYVFANNVRQVLQFVESGNVQAGLVYITDAKTSSKVKVVQTISDSLHDPITYPIAVVNRSPNQAEARAYTEFLASDAAKTVFRSYGFVPL